MLDCSQGRCRIQGPVTLLNVEALRAQGLRLLAGQDAVIDLSGVTQADSAALSVLLEWSRAAAASGRALRFENANPNLRTLADLYDVRELLPGL
jgi:phospholipid transport system transporter-binding protein